MPRRPDLDLRGSPGPRRSRHGEALTRRPAWPLGGQRGPPQHGAWRGCSVASAIARPALAQEQKHSRRAQAAHAWIWAIAIVRRVRPEGASARAQCRQTDSPPRGGRARKAIARRVGAGRLLVVECDRPAASAGMAPSGRKESPGPERVSAETPACMRGKRGRPAADARGTKGVVRPGAHGSVWAVLGRAVSVGQPNPLCESHNGRFGWPPQNASRGQSGPSEAEWFTQKS
jgi:hypothetical protein